jgi:hypothetical protein
MKSRKILSLFNAYPADLIQQWCLVSKQQAEHYKAGRRFPGKQALRLFQLFSRNKVLGPEWDGWRVVGDRLIPPNGRGFTQAHLQGYEIVWQLLHELDQERAHELSRKIANNDPW